MSHIDSFAHRQVGTLLGRYPIYQALEKINGDFYARRGQLILGGGSGEHPAMVILDPAACVAALYWCEADSAKVTGVRDDLCFAYEQIFKRYDWLFSDCHAFFEGCEPAHQAWHYRDDDSTLEQWLMCQIGALIYQHLPQLLPTWAQQQRVLSQTLLFACAGIEPSGQSSYEGLTH